MVTAGFEAVVRRNASLAQRRKLAPLIIAVGASVVSIFLAVFPGLSGPAIYDPGVAVLTATLIAVIWYTFFTFGIAKHAQQQAELIRSQLRMLLQSAAREIYEDISKACALRRPATVMISELAVPIRAAARNPENTAELASYIKRRSATPRFGGRFDMLRTMAAEAPGEIRLSAEDAIGVVVDARDLNGLKTAVAALEKLLAEIEALEERQRARLTFLNLEDR